MNVVISTFVTSEELEIIFYKTLTQINYHKIKINKYGNYITITI